MQPADCYKMLGVPFGASTEEVTAAYKKLSEKFHPDANAGDPFLRERFKEVQEAYQTLTNPVTTESSRQTMEQELLHGKNIMLWLLLFPQAKSVVKQLAVQYLESC